MGPVVAGAVCLDNLGNSNTLPTQSDIAACQATEPAQQWNLDSTNHCLGVPGGSLLDGGTIWHRVLLRPRRPVDTHPERRTRQHQLQPVPGRPGDGPAGTKLVQEDCYGQAGEIWAAG